MRGGGGGGRDRSSSDGRNSRNGRNGRNGRTHGSRSSSVFPAQSFIPLPALNVVNVPGKRVIKSFLVSDFIDHIVTVSRIEAVDQFGD